jgi:ABC-type nitrate/sulfonate/bicarbonate transport system permease component
MRKAVPRRAAAILWPLVLPAVLLLGWWFWSAGSANPYFPSLSQILASFAHTWFGTGFSENLVPSVLNLLTGYVIGASAGILVGIAVGRVAWLRWLLTPLINYGRSLPPPALLPFALLVFGIGAPMEIAFISFGVAFPVILNTVDGILAIDPTVEDVCLVYRIPRRLRLPLVVLPAAAPQIITGLRTGLSLAVLLMVVSELTAATRGIGFFTLQAEQNFNYADMWSGILLVAVIGVVLNFAFERFVERPLLFWNRAAGDYVVER